MGDAIIKIGDQYYKKNKDIKNLLMYISGESKSKEKVRYCGCRGLPKKPEEATERMIQIQKFYNKDNKRRVYQLIISFPKFMEDVNCVKIIAENIAAIIYERYQVYYGIHEDTENLHIHYAINAVSYKDGKKWHKSKSEFREMQKDFMKCIHEISSSSC